MSKITHAERERRQMLADQDTPQMLAGLLLVAESVAHGTAVSTWTRPDGTVMTQFDREEMVKAAILDMQLREIANDNLDAS